MHSPNKPYSRCTSHLLNRAFLWDNLGGFMKEEFEKIFYSADEIDQCKENLWAWIDQKLKESFQRGFDDGVKWERLENKDEEL